MESSKKKRNSVLPIIVSVGIATSMGVVAGSTPEVAYASSNATTPSTPSTAMYADRSGSENDNDQVITFKDPLLKSELLTVMKRKHIISDYATDITIADAERLDDADLSFYSHHKMFAPQTSDNIITSLDGIQYFTNLKNLNLDTNGVRDLSPLSGLTNLKNLNLYHNKVSDLSPLKNLRNLEELELSSNQVSDLSPLKNLRNLEELKIDYQDLSINSADKKTTLTVNGLSGATFTIQGKGNNSIGSINNGVFTLSKDLPYSGTISIKIVSRNITIGYATCAYNGTITLNLNVPKTEILIKGKMKYEADSSLDYQEKKVEKAANDGTRTTYADGRDPVEAPAQEGLTKV
ncbi:leucine-rich repeat domain-containing protein, partial [Gardnerella vaginalis]|uniref:leucine-rich repeat domain-containing protein n=1 Tax=Gardnerella vaginalis TaxID=2702 RepID=UPI0039EEADDF